jgi:hypothetical protein
MVTVARPLDALITHAKSGASGEFVCAAKLGEIHVYLQKGKIAWATDSKHAFAFASYLQAAAGIDKNTFRQVVEECRREKLPLGETIVAWGLTTLEGVREALFHQVEQALRLLSSVDTGQALFLERVYRKYDERLVFHVSEFLDVLEPSEALPSPLAESQPPPSAHCSDLARQLRSSVEGLSWVEVLKNDQVVDADPVAQSGRVASRLARSTLLDGADFIAVRSACSSVLGLSLSESRSVWCRIIADSTFGAVVSAIWSVAGVSEQAFSCAPPAKHSKAWSIGAESSATNEAIRMFLTRASDVLGTIVLANNATKEPVAGYGCGALEIDRCLDVARRRRHSLGLALTTDDGQCALDSIGFDLRTMVSGERSLWCYGAEIEPEGETLWLFLDRKNSQGLGWAYLTALTRALERTRANSR